MSPPSPAPERSPSAVALDTVALDTESDPVRALAEAYRAGGRVSLATSGTTGRPRRVVRTAASWVDSFVPAAALAELTRTGTVWVPGPLAATMNLYAVCLAAHLGAERVTRVEDASHAFVTPAGLHGLLNRSDLGGGLRLVVAGDRLGPELADRAEGRGWSVCHYYGAAQLSFVAWGRDAEGLRPFPEVEVETREGVVWVRSPWVAEREELDAGTSPVLRLSPDGWASVGDRGRVADDGTVRVTGRGDAVVTGGATVLVTEVEAALAPRTTGDLAVIGLAHAELGQVVAAVYTRADDLPALTDQARRELSPSHRPRRWLLRPGLPLTPAGKVDRAALATWAAEQ